MIRIFEIKIHETDNDSKHPREILLGTNLGATALVRHSSSKDGSTAGFLTAARITLRAMSQFFSCFSENMADTPPKAMVFFIGVIAGSKNGSSISNRKSNLFFTSWIIFRLKGYSSTALCNGQEQYNDIKEKKTNVLMSRTLYAGSTSSI
jgi:hypothetical protein